ncbi:P-loop NTPase [Candidatus Poribacteria bacterium]|nr:P-loop NTPase [Candidatus Poribacteria bacterium]
MKSITVISGKGGTGKTILTASFAALAESKVMADCDVDAADLHLILKPEILKEEVFLGGQAAKIDKSKCIECDRCLDECRFDAISENFVVDPIDCEGCALCYHVCPVEAIEMIHSKQGRCYISKTRHGHMVHAKLGIAEENSGKLVALVRKHAREIAERENIEYVIVDGPPGIGCPVISAITGASLVLAVTEPTVSGLHDLKRVVGLANHFGIKALVCVNKHDLNPAYTRQIELHCQEVDAEFVGKISFDTVITKAMLNAQSVVEYQPDSSVSEQIKSIWQRVDEVARTLP